MPMIIPSSDLRNRYNEISEFCREHAEPVYLTKNGRGDLVVMSMEVYERLVGRSELYRLLDDGSEDMRTGRTKPFSEVFSDVRKDLP
ncbi:MAG: type II toxin-antitoxin system Phd/YefM family antitoxin [Firmicutes bacterium]|jgi:prevent-host-death family protein|nr:type II toxin-antitoxin system Phd/YefM family antitoxin [Bacillota bacterium]